MQNEEIDALVPKAKRSPEEIRNLIGFWILGLTNNFAYMVMLSSAHDILTPANMTNVTAENRTGRLIEHCNPMGTGVILLADILPALIIKLLAPVALQRLPYLIRVCFVILFSLSSFILVSSGSNVYFVISIIGVVCASAAAGLGETTYLGLMSHFDKNMVSTWSSGTGAAGVLATVSYAGILALGVSASTTLLLMTIVPVIMAFSYFILLIHPSPGLLKSPSLSHHIRHHYRTFSIRRNRQTDEDDEVERREEKFRGDDEEGEVKFRGGRSFREKAMVLKPLARYMVPLFFVYLIEYFINQALYELLQFNNSWLELHEQYRWYLAIYQVGAFIARSSVNLVHIRKTWIFPLIQACVCVVLLCQVFFRYIPYILIIFVIVIIEGLISGAAYVNTFYSILNYMEKQDQELATSITCTSDSLGITVAALVATEVHNAICKL